MADSSSIGRASSTQVDPSGSGSSCLLWLLDSSASLHMTPDATFLHHSRPPPHVTRVRVADGTLLHVLLLAAYPLASSPFPLSPIFHVYR